ncbi:MAG TPA: hypothetical protein HA346_04265 [Thermoplasmata archaeon]|nr:hypothetical protein [Thermoplasmata archaeon]
MRRLISSFFLLFSVMFSFNASACDTKSCEAAYLAETQQYVANHIRRAEAYKAERHAHSLNRERRAYALFVHMHFMLHGHQFPLKKAVS